MLASTPSDLPLLCVAGPVTGCHTNCRLRPARSWRSKRILTQVDRQVAPDIVSQHGLKPCSAPLHVAMFALERQPSTDPRPSPCAALPSNIPAFAQLMDDPEIFGELLQLPNPTEAAGASD